jgi:hypothetical protein
LFLQTQRGFFFFSVVDSGSRGRTRRAGRRRLRGFCGFRENLRKKALADNMRSQHR